VERSQQIHYSHRSRRNRHMCEGAAVKKTCVTMSVVDMVKKTPVQCHIHSFLELLFGRSRVHSIRQAELMISLQLNKKGESQGKKCHA